MFELATVPHLCALLKLGARVRVPACQICILSSIGILLYFLAMNPGLRAEPLEKFSEGLPDLLTGIIRPARPHPLCEGAFPN